jgi:hypothetical protein
MFSQFLVGQEVSAEQAPVFAGYGGGLYEFNGTALFLDPISQNRVKVVAMDAGVAEKLHHLDLVGSNPSWILNQQVVFTLDEFTLWRIVYGHPE